MEDSMEKKRGEEASRLGLVLEGGGMRGIYTSGILDEFLLNGIKADGLVGVSAGILHGVSYVSEQVGRDIRYYIKLRSDKRFMSLQSLIKTGNLCETEFCYNEISDVLAPIDFETFAENAKRMEVFAGTTNLATGKPEYLRLTDVREQRDRDITRASASLPMVSRTVVVDGKELMDGGTADSIPIEFMRNRGYTKNIVVLTQVAGYEKGPDKTIPIMKLKYKDYPEYVKAAANRHVMYNETLKKIDELEKAGEILVIRPSRDLGVGRTEKDTEKLKRMYKLGRFDAQNRMKEILDYVKG